MFYAFGLSADELKAQRSKLKRTPGGGAQAAQRQKGTGVVLSSLPSQKNSDALAKAQANYRAQVERYEALQRRFVSLQGAKAKADAGAKAAECDCKALAAEKKALSALVKTRREDALEARKALKANEARLAGLKRQLEAAQASVEGRVALQKERNECQRLLKACQEAKAKEAVATVAKADCAEAQKALASYKRECEAAKKALTAKVAETDKALKQCEAAIQKAAKGLEALNARFSKANDAFEKRLGAPGFGWTAGFGAPRRRRRRRAR